MMPESYRYDVFISYPHAQKNLADAVCATLEQNKIRCWIAPRDVLPGEPFAKAIIRAINESRLFVLIFSAETNESDHVKNEVERAVSKGLSIIVFRVQDVVPTEEMEYYLSRRHWLDAMTPPIEAHFQKLVKAIRVLLSMPSGQREEIIEAVPDQNEQKVADLRMRAREAIAQTDWSQAITLLEQAAALLPEDPKVAEMLQAVKRDQRVAELRRQAQGCLDRKDWTGAIALLEQASQLAPGDKEVAASLEYARRSQDLDELLTRSRRLAETQDWRGALALLRQAQEIAPRNEEVQRLASQAMRNQQIIELKEKARAAYSAGLWERARAVLEELRTLVPEDIEAREMLSVASREEARRREFAVLVAGAKTATERAQEATSTRQWDVAQMAWEDAEREWSRVITAAENYLSAGQPDPTWREQLTEAQRRQKEAWQQSKRLQRLAERYAEAAAALQAKKPDQAIPILAAIVDELPAYRDAALLLNRAQGQLKAQRLMGGRRLWLGAGALVLVAVVVVAALVSGLLPPRTAGPSKEQMTTLQQASLSRLVDVELRGTGAPYGDCIIARLVRRTQEILSLELARGTLLLSKDSTVQDMIVMRVRAKVNRDGSLTETDTIRIADDNPHEYLLEAYGLDSRLKSPEAGTAYVVAGPATQTAQRVLQAAEQLDPGNEPHIKAAVQLALWLLTGSPDRENICSRIACQQEDLVLAERMLAVAGFAPLLTPTRSPTALVVAQVEIAPTSTSSPAATVAARAEVTPTSTSLPSPTMTPANTTTPEPVTATATSSLRDATTAHPAPTETVAQKSGHGIRPAAGTVDTPTPSPVSIATTTPTQTATNTRTATATRQVVVTATPSPTATRAQATPTAAVRPVTPTRSPTPPKPAGTLALKAPADGETFTGRNTKIKLVWSPAARPLTPEEYYLVTIFFPHGQETWTDYQWTREPEIILPEYLYDNVTGDRSFRWHVSLVKLNTGSPSGNPENRTTLIIAPGSTRTFRWLIETGGGGEQPRTTPTITPRSVEPTITPRP